MLPSPEKQESNEEIGGVFFFFEKGLEDCKEYVEVI